MPIPSLAYSPLLFLGDPATRLDRGPYGIRPFINNHFRLLCGLRPVRDAEDAKPNDDDLQDANGIPMEYSALADGFVLTKEAAKGIKPKDKKFFTDSARVSQGQYLTLALNYASQHRAAASSAGKSRGQRSSRKTEQQGEDDRIQPCISSKAAKNTPSHTQFQGAILGMYNRPDGVMARTADVMKRTSRSPVHVWRDEAADEPDVDPYSLRVKSARGLLNDITTQASLELFGTIALTPSTRVPRPGYKTFVNAILDRVWERESRRLNRTLSTAVETRDKCQTALEGATEEPTWGNLKEASNSMKKYKDLVEITGGEMDESIQKLEKTLEDIWAALGYVRAENGSIRRVKATKKAVSMSDEAMDRAYANYVELHFPPQQEAVEELTENLANALNSEDVANVNLLSGSEGSDIGVSEFANTTLDEMLRLLGLLPTRKIPFTSDNLQCQWHQLVAISVQLKAMFTKKLGEKPRSTLLCDEVGLGKTAEIIGTLCMLVHLIELQQRNLPLVPLLAESGHIYFAGQERIPSLPSIILMPKSLCIQWNLQFQRFTIPGAFRLIDYAKKGSDRISYFVGGGDYDTLVAKAAFPHRVVFLCTFTSIGAETGDTLSRIPTGVAGREQRFRGEPPTIVTNNAPDCTIFSKTILYFACDELHQLRNATTAQDGATRLSCNSLVRTGATATPVFNGAKDAISAGVIMRIPEIIEEAGLELGQELLESQRSRLKEWKAGQSEPEDPVEMMSDSEDIEHQHTQQKIANKLLKEGDPRGYKAFFVQQPSIEKIRKILAPYIIRRTSKSRTPDGKFILMIPDFVESLVYICLNEFEKKGLVELYNRLMNEKPTGLQGEMLLSWNAFLIDYKHALFHHLMRAETNSALESFWENWTLDNFRELASSKLIITIEIIDHYKDPSAEPLFFNRDGTRDLEREANFIPPPSLQAPFKPRKILIFIMYDRHTQVTKFVLDLHGYKYVEYNGSKSDIERDQAVKNFESQDDITIMLLSNVGTTGLNLTMASVILFLSGLWSGLETKQTIGRCCRPGQLHAVHVYHILAPDTADEILLLCATSKTMMESHFFVPSQALAAKIFHRDDNTDSDGSDDEAPLHYRRSAVAPRALKSEQQATVTAQPEQPTSKKAKPRKRKAPTSSQPARGPTQQDTGASGSKRRKVSDRDHESSVQPQVSSAAQEMDGTSQVSTSNENPVAGPSNPGRRPKPRPRRLPMRVQSDDENSGAITLSPPTTSIVESVVADPPSTSAKVPITTTSSVSPAPAPVSQVPSTDSTKLSPSDHKLNTTPNGSPISTVSTSVPKNPLKQPAAPLSSSTGPATAVDPSMQNELFIGVPSSPYDDPDVDVVGDYEGSKCLGDRTTDEPHPSDTMATIAPSPPPKVVLAVTETFESVTFPDEDTLMSAFLNDEVDSLDRNLVLPAQLDQSKAKGKATAGIPSAAPFTSRVPPKTWRESTTVRSSAKLVPQPNRSGSNASVPPNRQIVPSRASGSSQDQSHDGYSKSGPSSQKLITMKGGFKDVSKEDAPGVLARNKRAVMEQVNRASQTGALGVQGSRRTYQSSLGSISSQTVPLQESPPRSKKNNYRTFHLEPEDSGAP